MIAQLGNMKCIFGHFIYKPVLIINTPGPVTGKGVLKRFGFTNTFKRIAFGFLNESIDTMEDFFISFLPIDIVIPGVVRENELHSISSLSTPFSFSSWTMDSNSRLAFLGDRKR